MNSGSIRVASRRGQLGEEERSQFEELKENFHVFQREFDLLASDGFKGPEMDRLASEFVARCRQKSANSIPYASCPSSTFPNCSKSQAFEEDVRILSRLEYSETQPSEVSRLMANVYRRASQASYARITFNKWKHGLEENRAESFRLARYAIRYDSSDFDCCFIYMMTLGWHLDGTRSALDRMNLARLFHLSIERCLRMRPQNAVAHHLLGRYNFNVARLSWIERKVASRLMDESLLGATFTDAERSFRHAHKLDPELAPSGLWMARVLLAQNPDPSDEVKFWLDLSLSKSPKEPTNEIERLESLELRSKLRL